MSINIYISNKLKAKSISWLLCCSLFCSSHALAQIPGSVAPGQGSIPAAEITGDNMTPPSVPSGIINNSTGSIFLTVKEKIPSTIYLRTDIYSHNNHQYIGKRTVLTIRPALLNAMQLDLTYNILRLNSSTKNDIPNSLVVDVSEEQLEKIQNMLISSSHNTNIMSHSTLGIFSYLPIVRDFSRYAVLLGVIFSTILFAIAAWAIVTGERGSTQRIIGTTAGLIILLAAFTIYRALISNLVDKTNSLTTSDQSAK